MLPGSYGTVRKRPVKFNAIEEPFLSVLLKQIKSKTLLF